MPVAVGIDLGTTNSAIAAVDEHGLPAVILNSAGEPVTPSVLCFRDGAVVAGQEAKELQAAGERQVAAFFKRQMGDPHFVFHADGRDWSATDLSAELLKALKAEAEGTLGREIGRAVITVPAYFRNPQREATIAAGRQAGLEVLQIVNEPTAAAVAYGFEGSDPPRELLVYDLGGGTFDVTVLRLGGDEIRILNSDGDHELGGKDWDDRIVEFLARRFEDEHGVSPLDDRESLSDLLVRAEDVKKRLSTTTRAKISIVHEGLRGSYELDRATFEEITADLMERTVGLTEKVLADVGLEPAAIDGVLLVGGATRMPMVRSFVAERLCAEPVAGINVDEVVALGAARVAAERLAERDAGRSRFALAGAVRTVDVTNHSLGMIAINEDGSAYVNSLILPKNTPIPCEQSRPYQHRTRPHGDNLLEIVMTQGESESPADVSYLGKYVVRGISHAPNGLAIVDIRYTYDVSGTVQAAASERATGRSLEVVVDAVPEDVPQRFLEPPQVTAPAHVTAYLAFDLSGSMIDEPLAEAKKAALGFLRDCDLSHTSLGIIAFADRVRTKLRACQNAKAIEKAIHELAVSEEVGYGNASDPFAEVHSLLASAAEPKFVVTLADGVWARQDRAIERAQRCHEAGIESIAIGFGGADREFLRRIASSDEASFFTSLGGLVETFSTIARVITESQGGLALPGAAAGDRRRSFLSRLQGR